MWNLYSKDNCKNCIVVKSLFEIIKHRYNSLELKSMNELLGILEDKECEFNSIRSFPVLINEETKSVYDYKEIMEHFGEPLLQENPNRFSLYPIEYPDIYEMYKKARASFWQPEEISLSQDLNDWNTLTESEKHFVKMILAFFASSDGIVNENINLNFSKEIQVPEARAFYTFQEAIETIHSETYSLLLDKYVNCLIEKEKLQKAIQHFPSIKMKADWAIKYMNRDNSFAKRLLAFACVEGIYFSGAFCAIFWLKKRNLLPGLAFSNELISRDEALHTDFACLIYSKLTNQLNFEEAKIIILDAVEIEKQFITDSLPCKLIGMNADLMKEYIEFVADRLLTQMKYKKVFHTRNPFDFMENISLCGKTNFFEKRVAEYAKANVMSGENETVFELDADF